MQARAAFLPANWFLFRESLSNAWQNRHVPLLPFNQPLARFREHNVFNVVFHCWTVYSKTLFLACAFYYPGMGRAGGYARLRTTFYELFTTQATSLQTIFCIFPRLPET